MYRRVPPRAAHCWSFRQLSSACLGPKTSSPSSSSPGASRCRRRMRRQPFRLSSSNFTWDNGAGGVLGNVRLPCTRSARAVGNEPHWRWPRGGGACVQRHYRLARALSADRQLDLPYHIAITDWRAYRWTEARPTQRAAFSTHHECHWRLVRNLRSIPQAGTRRADRPLAESQATRLIPPRLLLANWAVTWRGRPGGTTPGAISYSYLAHHVAAGAPGHMTRTRATLAGTAPRRSCAISAPLIPRARYRQSRQLASTRRE